MRKLFTLLLFVLAAGLLSTEKVQASHCQGADLTYTYTGNPNEYLITLRFYRDCYGIAAPGIATICYQSANAGVSQTLDLYPIPGTGQPIPNSLCIITTGNCASGVGTEEWIYQGTVTLPSAETDWIIGFELNARNAAITNLLNPANYGLYVSTYINNLDFPTNSSPVFSSIPVTVFCINNQFFYPQGATDIDGDSLHYTLVAPQDASGFCPLAPIILSYVSPFTATNPLTTLNNIFTLDANTGLISFTPTAVEVAVICVLVEEFDTTQVPAVKKGSVKRDLQVLITPNCNVIQPFPTLVDSTVINGTTYTNVIFANCADTSVIVTLTEEVQCGSIAADGSDFRAIRPNGQPNPIFKADPVNCTNGKTDSVRVYFYFPLTQVRTALYIKKGTDGNTMLSECGNSIYETDGTDTSAINDTISIIVQDTSVIDLNLPVQTACVFNQFTIHFFDQMLCSTIKPNGTDFQVVDATGAVFPVASAYGNCVGSPSSNTQDITVVMANPVVGVSPFYVISLIGGDNNTLANFCETYINVGDTIAIIDASQPLLFSIGPDVNQCITDPFPVLNTQLPGVTYAWYLNGVLLPDTTQSITASLPGTYIVNVNASPTCNGADTAVVSFIQAPVADILANGVSTSTITICQGSPYPSLDGTSAGATSYNWLLNGTSVSTSATYTPTADGQYILQVSAGGTCLGLDTITINTIAQVIVNLGNDITKCSIDPNPTLDAGGVFGATYLWSTGETTQTISPSAAGTYIVTVTYGGVCSASDTLLLTVNTTPTNPALQDQSVCYNGTAGPFDANPGNTQPLTSTYSWVDGSGNIVGTSNLYQPLIAGTYTVTINNNGCIITDDAVLVVEPSYIADAGVDQSICETTPSTTFTASSNSSLSTTYAWLHNGTPVGAGSLFTAAQAGTYVVIVTDQHNCTAADTTVLTVESRLVAPVPTCAPSSSSSFAYIYTWNAIPGATSYEVSVDGGATWVPANTPTGQTSHGVAVPAEEFVVRAQGTLCDGITSEPAPCAISVPNFVTPNGDNINDVFFIKNLEQYDGVDLKIYNRWGNVVYESSDYGAANNYGFKDEPDGTYFYVLNVPGTEITTKGYPSGYITVVRDKK
ncbi:MAG: gliding motility-associated C-terminal domain-containing protein [Bacteroidia bacterium]